jgi:hypothetical protein
MFQSKGARIDYNHKEIITREVKLKFDDKIRSEVTDSYLSLLGYDTT